MTENQEQCGNDTESFMNQVKYKSALETTQLTQLNSTQLNATQTTRGFVAELANKSKSRIELNKLLYPRVRVIGTKS